MAYDGTLNFNTKIDSKGFNKDIGLLSKSVKKLGGAIALAFGTRALIEFGKQAVEIASDLQEVQNVVDTVFGDMSTQIDEFSKTAIDKFGLSELSAKKYASTIGAILKPTGIATKEIANMATVLTGASGGMASFFNRSSDVVNQDIQSYFAGSAETMLKYGLNAKIANLETFALSKGINKAWKEMSEAEQQTLRFDFLVKNLGYTFNDFEKTQDSWANQTRILTERWKQFLGLIGQNLINVFTPAIKALNNFLSILIAATEQFNSFYTAVTGKQIEQQTEVTSGISDSVSEQDALTGAVEDTNKALKNTVAGFDELNVLQKQSATDVATSEIGGVSTKIDVTTDLGETEVSEISPFYEKLLELLSDLQSIDLTNLNNALSGLKEATEPLVRKLFSGLEWAYKNLFVPLAKFTIEEVLPRFLELLSVSAETLDIVLEKLQPYATWFWEDFLIPLGKWTGGLLLTILDQMITDLQEFNRWLSGEEIAQEDNVFTTAKKDAKSLGELLDPLGEAIEEDIAWFKGEEFRGDNVFTTAKTDAKSLQDFIEQASKEEKTMLGGFVKWIENNVITPLDDGFWYLWDAVFNNQNSAFYAMTENITNFINNWITKFENFFNAITRGINDLVDKFNELSFDIPDWVPEIGGKEFSLNLRKFSEITLPKLSTGTDIPLGAQFERYGYNTKSSESDFASLLEEMKSLKGQETVIKFDGDLAELGRILKPVIEEEGYRRGKKLKIVTD